MYRKKLSGSNGKASVNTYKETEYSVDQLVGLHTPESWKIENEKIISFLTGPFKITFKI